MPIIGWSNPSVKAEMGQVWKHCKSLWTGRWPSFSTELMRHPTAKERVLKEAITLGRIDHRNVVRIIECFGPQTPSHWCWSSSKVAVSVTESEQGRLRMAGSCASHRWHFEERVRYTDPHRPPGYEARQRSPRGPRRRGHQVPDLGIAHDESATRPTRMAVGWGP